METVKPRALAAGARIGLIAPSGSAIALERVDVARAAIEELGFEVVEGRSCRAVHGYLAGSDELRAQDMNGFFADGTIDGIFCLKGGYGTPRILDRLDYATIRDHPKAFVGYSDITGTHLALGRECGLVTFHGPMPHAEKLPAWDELSRTRLLDCLGPGGGRGVIENPDGRPLVCLNAGRAQGRLVGGNLSLLAATMGTPWELDTRGRILFIEDIGERPYRVDRMLTQLRLAGKLDAAAGFVIGDWNDCVPEEGKKTLSLDTVIEEILLTTGKPVLANLAAGHCSPNLMLPLGVEVELDAAALRLEFLEAATT
jgi:muramoyltetrapeptide carboxypeptidase